MFFKSCFVLLTSSFVFWISDCVFFTDSTALAVSVFTLFVASFTLASVFSIVLLIVLVVSLTAVFALFSAVSTAALPKSFAACFVSSILFLEDSKKFSYSVFTLPPSEIKVSLVVIYLFCASSSNFLASSILAASLVAKASS